MKITFLVGNGFDIGAGFKTSYKDFHEWYLEQTADSDEVRLLKNNIKSKMERWSDLEKELGQYTQYFTSDEKSVDKFANICKDVLQELSKYLNCEIKNNLNTKALDEQTLLALRKGIREFYSEIYNANGRDKLANLIRSRPSENIDFHFISFNYTTTLDDVVEQLSREPLKRWTYRGISHKIQVAKPVLHVHGMFAPAQRSRRQPDNSSSPILGVSDSSQIRNETIRDAIGKTLIKLHADENGAGNYARARDLIGRSQIVCIFGMSLGETDLYWWKTIVDWLVRNPDTHLVVFWYKRNCSHENYQWTEPEIERDVYSRLGLTERQRGLLGSRIHVVINTQKVLKVRLSRREECGSASSK